jgi:hypothetical protein
MLQLHCGKPVVLIVAFRGRHTRSHPPETNPEVVFRKGKASKGEAFATKPGNPLSPSVGTPFSHPQFLSRPFSEVSYFLNFRSVPVEFSPLVWDWREKPLSLPLP